MKTTPFRWLLAENWATTLKSLPLAFGCSLERPGLISRGLWPGFAAGVGAFLHGVALRVLDKEEGARYAMGGHLS